jgi:branched-chain amino acid transport system ATP-binding protein
MMDTSQTAVLSEADQPRENPVLAADGATRRFGGLVAVNEVTFDVRRGEIFGLIGPNGAGKTTLFNLFTGLQPASSGQLLHDGEAITNLKPHRIAKRGIARTFQNIRLFGGLTALENVKTAKHLHTKAGTLSGVLGIGRARREEPAVEDAAYSLLELVGLSDRANDEARNFSYGDQRRLEIARALALEPRVLLLDEPAAGMNPNEKLALSLFIREIRDRFDLTVMLIEHNVPLVMGLCDRIAVLNFGQLIALGKPEFVQNDPAVIEAYLGAQE